MNKKLKILLIFSLFLNFFMVGFIVGEIRNFKHKKADSEVLREFIDSHKEERKQIDEERQNVLKLVREKEFDREKYLKQVDKVSELQEKMYKKFAISTADKLREMPEEKRNEIIDRIIHKRGKLHMGKH